MSRSYIIHGMLQDVIDYRRFIEIHANTPYTHPFRVVKSRKSGYGYVPNKKINKKGRSLGMLRR